MAQQSVSPYTGRPITNWYDHEIDLFDVDGDKIGNVVEVNPDFVVCQAETGFLGLGEPRTFFIPRDQIARQDGDVSWFLAVDKDELQDHDWTVAPTGSVWSDEWQAGQYNESDLNEGRTRIRRYEEDLEATPVQRQAGEVVVKKNVVEETKTIDVPVRREEVHIERRPISGNGANDERLGSDAFTDESIRMPLMEEDVEVRKVARPVEEIEVSKAQTQDTRRVQDTVRREEFDVDDNTQR